MDKKYIWYLLIPLCLAIYFVYHWQEEKERESYIMNPPLEEDPIASEQNKDQDNAVDEETVIKVDVKGAVQSPGVYIATKGDRVIDIITKAGGFTKEADQNQVNLAKYVQDEMVIFVPKKGEEVFTPDDIETSHPSSESNKGKVNINQANETELQTIPGIGPSKAKAIVEYREQNGLFKRIEDIKNVTGIGDKTFDKLKEHITVQ